MTQAVDPETGLWRPLNYRTIADLNQDILDGLPSLPPKIDAVAGVPRSGLLAASILALHLNLPLTDIDGLLRGDTFDAGKRAPALCKHPNGSEPLSVLILDDSVRQGTQMRLVKDKIEQAGLPHTLRYAAVYASQQGTTHVDQYFKLLPDPRLFEWNVMDHSILKRSCLDLDGVLCCDPTGDQNDDGPNYEAFMANAEPLFVPRTPLGWIVTSRLEKYRRPTEAWLAGHGIEYRQLIMTDLPSMETRRALGTHADFKAKAYEQTNAALFIESSPRQAARIAQLTGRQVYCFATRRMVKPPVLQERRKRIVGRFRALPGKARRWLAS